MNGKDNKIRLELDEAKMVLKHFYRSQFKDRWRLRVLNNHKISCMDRLVGLSIIQAYEGDEGQTCEDLNPYWLSKKLGISLVDLNRSTNALERAGLISERTHFGEGTSHYWPSAIIRIEEKTNYPF